jgi:hypothetical protein
MAGMMPQDPAAAAAPPAQGMAPQQAAPQEAQPEGEMATPEEQQLYNEVVTRAKKLVFDEQKQEVRPAIVKMLKEGDDPVQALGQAAGTVFFRVLQSATKAGIEIPPSVEVAAAEEVFSDVAQIASTVTGTDFMADDQQYEGAFYVAVDECRQMMSAAGMVDQEAALAEMQDMSAADQSGQLDGAMQAAGA